MEAIKLRLVSGGIAVSLGILATIVINLTPDVGSKILLAITFGFFLGLPWMRYKIEAIVGGLVLGVVMGIALTLLQAMSTPVTDPSGLLLLNSMKWLLPLTVYSAEFGLPLLDNA